MHDFMREFIKEPHMAALATSGPHGLNVVPISVVEVKGDEIHLYDFFMRKTAENIKSESTVSLTCWRKFEGFQLKAKAVYEVSGAVYEQSVLEMRQRFPDRVLRAVVRLTPVAVYEIAPGLEGKSCFECGER